MSPVKLSGTVISTFIIGSSMIGLACCMPFVAACPPAISKDTPDESTGGKLPSTRVAFMSTTGYPATTPPFRAFLTPFSTEGMYSRGTTPPTMVSENSNPVPRGIGSTSIQT